MLWLVGESYILIEGAYMKLILGDCLLESEQIENGSVDLILTDLPYGTMNGFAGIDWDFAIDPVKDFNIANRILRKNGKMVLFSQEPYTSQLITHAIPNVPFNYRMIWEKDNFANALLCNKAPVGMFEDVLVFSKLEDSNDNHPLREYAEKVHQFIGLPLRDIFEGLGMVKVRFFRYSDTQFSLCPEKTYIKLINIYGIDKMDGFIPFNKLKEIDILVKSDLFPSVFNLWEGNKYKSNILKYKKDYNGFHPTQKPVLLLEDLVKTFSNEGNLVVDLTMGSGSTGVACKNTNREFIGIEKDEGYFKIAQTRIQDAQSQGVLL